MSELKSRNQLRLYFKLTKFLPKKLKRKIRVFFFRKRKKKAWIRGLKNMP